MPCKLVLAVLIATIGIAAPIAVAAPGDLDTAFGTGGKLVQAYGPRWSNLYAAVRQDDGKIVAVGYSDQSASQPYNRDFAVMRLNANGTLDMSFNAAGTTPGITTAPVGPGTQDDNAYAVALGPGGTIYVAGSTDPVDAGDSADFAVARFTAAGALDTGFAGDGVETYDVGNFGDAAYAAALQPGDGKVVMAGYSPGTTSGMHVLRIDGTTGALDSGFNGTGVQEIDFSDGVDRATALALRADGRIVVAGTANLSSSNDDVALAQLTGAGALDTADFGAGAGKVRVAGAGRELAAAMVRDGQDRIVVAGTLAGSGVLDFMVSRYTADGTPDTAFSVDGVEVTRFLASDGTAFASASGVRVQPDGKILTAGNAFSCQGVGCSDAAFARYNDDGTLDTTFGNGGRAVHDLAGSANEFAGALLLGSGIWVGFGFDGSVETMIVAQIVTEGSTTPPPPDPGTPPPGTTPIPGAPPPTTQTPPPNEFETCNLRNFVLSKRKAKKKAGKRRKRKGKASASAGPPGEAFQAKCVLPPTKKCPAKQGLDLQGGPLDDTLSGTAGNDTLNGQGGRDRLSGADLNDILRGGPGRDLLLAGEACDDVLFSTDYDDAWSGGPGDDILNGKAARMDGGAGDDYVYNGGDRGTSEGGKGDDVISVTSADTTTVRGGEGNDTIDAVNRSEDKIVDCGPGKDSARIDDDLRGRGRGGRDPTKGCEKIIVVG